MSKFTVQLRYTNNFLHYSSSIQITISWYLIHVEQMARNGNNIKADMTLDTTENDLD